MHDIYPSVMDFPAAWCDAFVDWCFYKAYGVTNAKGLIGGNFNDYTPSSAQLYKDKKAWYTSNPIMGDQIFFKNSKRICHTGLVYEVDNTHVYTVEGNTSGASGVIANGGGVCKKKYKLTDPAIAGYGRPKYDITVDTYTVIKGDTGLIKIGNKLGVDWKEIARLNNIKAPYVIHIGQVLLIRDSGNKTTSAKPTATTTTSTTKPSSTSKPATTVSKCNPIIQKGQQHAVNFTGKKISVDGISGSETKMMKALVLQCAMNLDYGRTIAEDGDFQTKSKAKLGSHYVKKGEKQYMVTAAEILIELNGIDPNGVEMPGKYGNGLVNAAKKFFGDDGTKITASEFLKLIK